MATDLTFGTPAEGNKAPTSPSIQASRLFQWLTASRAGASVMLRHAFNVTRVLRLYVDASYEVRLSRAIERDGITEEAFQLREKSQTDVDYRDVDYGVTLYVLTNEEFNFEKRAIEFIKN